MADATRTVQIVLKVVDQATKSIKATNALFKEMGVRTANMTKKVKTLSAQDIIDSSSLKQVMPTIKQMSAGIKEVTKRARGFDMAMLGIMFGGMALTRMFGGMAKALQQTFIKAQDETSGLSQATLRLSAAWEFFKFSLVDALNADWFIGWVDNLIGLLDKLSQMNDVVKLIILSFIALGLVIGKGLFMWGQWALLSGALKTKAAEIAGIGTAAETAGKKGIFSSKFAKGIGITANLVLVGFSIAEFVKSMKADDTAGMVGSAIAGALGVAGAIVSTFNPAVGAVLFIAGSVVLTITKFKTQIKDAFTARKQIMDFLTTRGITTSAAIGSGQTGRSTESMGAQVAEIAAAEIDARKKTIEGLQEGLDLGNLDVAVTLSKIKQLQDEIFERTHIGKLASDNFEAEVIMNDELRKYDQIKYDRQLALNEAKQEELRIEGEILATKKDQVVESDQLYTAVTGGGTSSYTAEGLAYISSVKD